MSLLGQTVYLGDGVYCTWDGVHIVLDLRAQDDTTRIALESEVLVGLVNHADAVAGEVRAERVREKIAEVVDGICEGIKPADSNGVES